MTEELRKLSYEVRPRRGTGVVASCGNGRGSHGPVRTELDALPVEEKTGLPYASQRKPGSIPRTDVPSGTPAGHGPWHMAGWTGAARADGADEGQLAWNGADDRSAGRGDVQGARAMIADGSSCASPSPIRGGGARQPRSGRGKLLCVRALRWRASIPSASPSSDAVATAPKRDTTVTVRDRRPDPSSPSRRWSSPGRRNPLGPRS